MVLSANRVSIICLWFPRLRGDGPDGHPCWRDAPQVPPPTRGWSPRGWKARSGVSGSPAYAGMVPVVASDVGKIVRFPRLRGDGPQCGLRRRPGWPVPPPTRGWSPGYPARAALPRGSPAYAGMVLQGDRDKPKRVRFPRLRGDGPAANMTSDNVNKVPPPTRGWSWTDYPPRAICPGSPAYAGMVPTGAAQNGLPSRFPRLRGDGPASPDRVAFLTAVPPPTRGWSVVGVHQRPDNIGSPAYAGMVPMKPAN